MCTNLHLNNRFRLSRGPTAKQQLLSSVGWGQVFNGRQAACHDSTQVTRVAQRSHRQAAQVNGPHQVRQQSPLKAHNAPPVRTNCLLGTK